MLSSLFSLDDERDEDVLTQYAAALTNAPEAAQALEKGVRMLNLFTNMGDLAGQVEACDALCETCRAGSGAPGRAIVDHGALVALKAILQGARIEPCRAAAELIAALCSVADQRRAVVRSGLLKPLIVLLRKASEPRLLREGARILAALAAEPSALPALLREDAPRALKHLCRSRAGATGSHSANLKPSTLMNAPYVIVPLLHLRSLMREGRSPSQPAAAARPAGERIRQASLLDHGVVAFHAAALCLHLFRTAVVLGCQAPAALWWASEVEPDLSAAPEASFGQLRVQLLEYGFYYTIFHAWALAQSYTPPSGALAAWAMVVAGGVLEGQGAYIGACLYKWVGWGGLKATPQPAGFWWANLGLAVGATVCAARYWQLAQAGGAPAALGKPSAATRGRSKSPARRE